MKRSDFLRKIGLGAGAIIIAPQTLVSTPTKAEHFKDNGYNTKFDSIYNTSIIPDLFMRYGEGVGLLEFMYLNG